MVKPPQLMLVFKSGIENLNTRLAQIPGQMQDLSECCHKGKHKGKGKIISLQIITRGYQNQAVPDQEIRNSQSISGDFLL